MKISLLKKSRKKEVINRLELSELAEMIRKSPEERKVFSLRLNYQFYKPQRMDDGQIAVDEQQHTVNLPRILFAVECMNFKDMQKGLKYNGLVVVEVNGLKTYEDAVAMRNQAARMDETVMAFLGASGKSVKIVCRGELFGKEEVRGQKEDGRGKMEEPGLPTKEDEIRQFHKNLYETARRAYQNQFGFDIEYLEPMLERTVYMSADPEMYFNPQARAFKADVEKHDQPEKAEISWESDLLMPGRTIKQYRRYTSFIGTTNQMQPLVGNHRDTVNIRQPLCLLRCQAGHANRAGQGDEQLPLQFQTPYGERLFRILALREIM